MLLLTVHDLTQHALTQPLSTHHLLPLQGGGTGGGTGGGHDGPGHGPPPPPPGRALSPSPSASKYVTVPSAQTSALTIPSAQAFPVAVTSLVAEASSASDEVIVSSLHPAFALVRSAMAPMAARD